MHRLSPSLAPTRGSGRAVAALCVIRRADGAAIRRSSSILTTRQRAALEDAVVAALRDTLVMGVPARDIPGLLRVCSN